MHRCIVQLTVCMYRALGLTVLTQNQTLKGLPSKVRAFYTLHHHEGVHLSERPKVPQR
jgi:hypothetical protein